MEKYTGSELVINMLMQVMWLAIFILISKLIWIWAEKRLAVQGG